MSVTSIENRSLIGEGPGALPLLVSLSEPNHSPRKIITLGVDSGQRRPHGPRNTEESAIIYNNVNICISFLAQASDTGEDFYFEGWIPNVPRGNIHGWYSARARKGWYARGHRYSVDCNFKNDF